MWFQNAIKSDFFPKYKILSTSEKCINIVNYINQSKENPCDDYIKC